MRPSHFFKYYTAEVAKIVLSTKKVRWNSPLNFNDPFDCFFSADPKFDYLQKKSREQILEIMYQAEEPTFYPENPYYNSVTALRRAAKVMPREKFESIIQPAFEKFLADWESWILSSRKEWRKEVSNLRLFCVCEANDNLSVG